MISLTDTLIELMEMAAPTGQEEPVLAWCREKWAAAGAEVTSTPIGNVLAHIPGDGPKLLIQGHADEIGFVVKSIDERGFIWLTDGQAGSRNFSERYPVGKPALIVARNGRIDGMFGAATGHILSTKADRGKTPTEDDIFVDIGVDSKEEAEALGVHVGAGVVWNPPARRLGKRLYGKAIDDRVSLALMTHLLIGVDHAAFRYDITVAATVQEEIGLIGALSLGQSDPFDLAIAIDNGPIADYPGTSLQEIPVQLGKGPTLVYKDSWAHYDRRIIDQLLDVAEANAIPVQRAIYPGFGSDGAALIRSGIPAALLAVSTRYTHSAFEMLDERDLTDAFDLLRAFVTADPTPLPLGPS
ncbi:MAG TPA: M20/M25/M40 family metallo-hydrolase [Thermomicrobiales bacterium]|nr:M20/M25/M40 family metallo-hydrolase [Thermomicrobiales bacterium]